MMEGLFFLVSLIGYFCAGLVMGIWIGVNMEDVENGSTEPQGESQKMIEPSYVRFLDSNEGEERVQKAKDLDDLKDYFDPNA